MMSETEKDIIRFVFENAKNGKFPEFGSPETSCDKCIFAGIACETLDDVVGCFGGWKWEE